MKCRMGVAIRKNKNGEFELAEKGRTMSIAKADEYIFQAVDQGITDDGMLIRLVMKEEQLEELIAGFRLAECVVSYGEFLEELTGHFKIRT